jgi:glycosyltransferase involved in cell wall biosynthesis
LKVLHICSDFAKQSIYNQLVSRLDNKLSGQDIYIPVRTADEVGRCQNKELNNTQYHYAFILNKWDRFNYFGKIKKTTNFIDQIVSIKNVDIIHAHFLFSDGGIAYNLYKKYNIPYIVAVRNTDLNLFFKYFIHLRPFALKILKGATNIVFLSNAYKDAFLEKYVSNSDKSDFLKKIKVIPNGVEDYWLQNNVLLPKSKDNFSVLYVGDFTTNKNILLTINAVSKLRLKGLDISFNIIGGGGEDEEKIKQLATENEWIHLYPRTSKREELREIYRKSHVFCMPSRYETFGLVYIEALSQGLPIIYTIGQGVSGYFEDGAVGYGVKPNNEADIAEKIELIMNNFDSMSLNSPKFAQEFSWDNISKEYIDIYINLYGTKH